jgi:hypothetical protein
MVAAIGRISHITRVIELLGPHDFVADADSRCQLSCLLQFACRQTGACSRDGNRAIAEGQLRSLSDDSAIDAARIRDQAALVGA